MCYTSQTGSKTRSVTQWSLCGSLPLRVSYCIYLTYLTATKTKSTRVSCPWCWWYISTVTGLLSTALLQWSLYPCQHSRRQYCLSVSFSVGRLVECHELCRVEERMDIFQDPFLIHVQNTVTVVAITLLLYPSLYPDHSLHPYYVFGHDSLCHRFFKAQPSQFPFSLCSKISKIVLTKRTNIICKHFIVDKIITVGRWRKKRSKSNWDASETSTRTTRREKNKTVAVVLVHIMLKGFARRVVSYRKNSVDISSFRARARIDGRSCSLPSTRTHALYAVELLSAPNIARRRQPSSWRNNHSLSKFNGQTARFMHTQTRCCKLITRLTSATSGYRGKRLALKKCGEGGREAFPS